MKKSRILLGASMLTILAVVFVAGIFFNVQVTKPIVEQEIVDEIIVKQREWKRNALADADPGSGNTGFMYIMVYPHQADPGTAYASNLSNATAYEYSDSTDCELTGETPWGVTVDFVKKIRINNTDGYNSSGSQWQDDWSRANISVDFDFLSDISDSAMTKVVIGTDGTTYRWYNCYINNGGSGYTITKGESFNITALTLDIYE